MTFSTRSWAIGATLLLHLAVLLMVMQQRPHPAPARAEQRLLVRLITQSLPNPPPPAPTPPPRPKAPARSLPPPVTVRAPAENKAPEVATAAPPDTITPSPTAALPIQAAASAPWLDPEKTRQVLRMHARDVPITEQAALASEAPRRVTSTERFGAQVQSTATGDCLKGEFLGGSMGLLSAPFWLLAEARGKCRR